MPEVLYDPIHRIITFSDRERDIIAHPFVQRLRFIRQLGLKSFVFPGAVHDRFSHGLGAMHMAGRVFDALDGRSEVFRRLSAYTHAYLRELLRTAALLHDVGHGPFSHASENLMPALGLLDVPSKWYETYAPRKQATHEDYSVLLIHAMSAGKEKVFTPVESQTIASLVHKKIKPPKEWNKFFKSPKEATSYHQFLKRLISGELDVDRMDYLLRDSYFTGVPYGMYDLEWLLNTIGVVMQKTGPVLTIHESGLRAFEDFLLARYHMFLQVYFHRTTSIFEYYIEQAIREKEISWTVPVSAKMYAELRDSTIFEAMFEAAKNPKNRWSNLLTRREPMTMVYRFDADDAPSRTRYNRIVSSLKRAHIPFVERSAHRSLSEGRAFESGAAGILISYKFIDQWEFRPVEQVSSLLQKYNEEIGRTYLYVSHAHYKKALATLHKTFNM
ncbi:MAG: HD domain-containing protein [bacterium]|nr:HD domain-containing protein [bacterium]